MFDIIGLAFGAFGPVWSVAGVLKVAPVSAKIYADFGGKLPVLTELCLSIWFPITLGLVPLAVVGLGIVGNAARWTRAILMGVVILLTFALPAIFLVGLYLPILDIAAAVRK